MKIKLSLILLLFTLSTTSALADPVVKPILSTGVIRCGTDLSVKSYAYKENDQWKGFDADICRAFAYAIYGDGNKFKMVDIRPHQIKQAFRDNMVDVMLSGGFYSAGIEAKYNASAVGLLYYDRQMFALKNQTKEAASMKDFEGSKICVAKTGDHLANLEHYLDKHDLQMTVLSYNTIAKAREALLLKRCDLITANSMLLKGLMNDNAGQNLKILPEEYAHKPVYAFVSKDNNALRVALKWVINGLYLAEDLGINQNNIKIIVANNDNSTRNLLGENEILWRFLGLQPDGLKNAIADLGNMAEIYERNLGSNSPYKMERSQANLIKNGGIVHAESFE